MPKENLNGKLPKIFLKNGSKRAKIGVFWPTIAVLAELGVSPPQAEKSGCLCGLQAPGYYFKSKLVAKTQATPLHHVTPPDCDVMISDNFFR